MIATTIVGGVNWEAALAVPGALDLAMDGLAVTEETPAAFEEAYSKHVGRWSLAGVTDEQLEGLAQAGIKLARLNCTTNGVRQVRFHRLLKYIAKELRKVRGSLSIDNVISSVRQTLADVEKPLQQLRDQTNGDLRKLQSAKDRFRRLLTKKMALQELLRDLFLYQSWITREEVFNIEPLARRILSSDSFRQLKGKTALLRDELAALLRARLTAVEETKAEGFARLFATESRRDYSYRSDPAPLQDECFGGGHLWGQDTAYSPD